MDEFNNDYHKYYMCAHCGKTYNKKDDRRVTDVGSLHSHNAGSLVGQKHYTYSFLEKHGNQQNTKMSLSSISNQGLHDGPKKYLYQSEFDGVIEEDLDKEDQEAEDQEDKTVKIGNEEHILAALPQNKEFLEGNISPKFNYSE